jgi:hypothetical protein
MPTVPTPTAADLRAAERRLEGIAPGYLAKVRLAAARTGRHHGDSGDVEAVLAEVAMVATVDVDVPTLSRRRSVSVLKRVVKTLIGWYLRYLGDQVSALGASVSSLGTALSERSDRLEADTLATALELQRLRRRVDDLEAAAGRSADGDRE